jgi:hypothetical protein
VLYLPPLNALFRTVPLTAAELAGCFAAGAAILGAVEIEKWWRRRGSGSGSGPRPGPGRGGIA